ncbi:MAG: Unknown protein [uncultured Sulfurovum sp.]|uniref:Uncharacterized protein n=1 Tax=uncultured Sulfurovum sp. TaxID=269237 RepID=A0A6S6T6J4_9BACT|nr:MAG: Unknown protein [uncultured Sulfurovum sp.]
MEAKNLKNLMVKHFDFLQRDYGFKYNASSNRYVKKELEVEVQHKGGALDVLLISQKQINLLPNVISKLLKKEFTYPEHFSSWIFSMGDVDSRLAYDAKLMKEYAKDIL